MRRGVTILCVIVWCVSGFLPPVFAASVNTYQVTGPLLGFDNNSITIQKGQERWQLSHDSSTHVNGDLKVGSKVTAQYRMITTSIEVKAEKGSEKSKKVP